MHTGRLIFAQLMDFLPLPACRHCVARYHGEYKVGGFSCLDQFLYLAFAQLTYRESLRDIETCLRAMPPKLYHLGIRGRVARSTLADANETRDWRIYADFAQIVIARARALYCTEPFEVELAETAYAFDATTIDLCLALFPWARFRRHKAAVKLHTLLDLRGAIPTVVAITDGKAADVTLLDALVFEPGAFYVCDRGYTDFGRLFRLTEALAFFVIRGKRGLDYARRVSRPVDTATGLRSDQTIVLCGPK
ncbi:MAG: transposase family protein, partial [candidate division NC10 bacterium]|nr:transposase family protein [candidate division NC10 bacterium]